MEIVRVENQDSFKFEKVELRKPTVRDSIYAQRVSGGDQGLKFVAALIASCAKFDGKPAVMEQVEKMELPDFLELGKALGFGDLPQPKA